MRDEAGKTSSWLAPVLLVIGRLRQGLGLGGRYGRATTYAGEQPPSDRGYAIGWIRATGTVGLALGLVIILACRELMEPKTFSEWAGASRSSCLSSC